MVGENYIDGKRYPEKIIHFQLLADVLGHVAVFF